jgi:energy-coupling factor transporter ATP-binding protein EcfA2
MLLGRSGFGKSTALKLTNGMLFPTNGQVLVEGRSTREWDPIKLKRRIGYVIRTWAASVIGSATYEWVESCAQALRAGARCCITRDRLNQDLVSLLRDRARRTG